MTESVIREFSGEQKDSVSRTYYYGVSGVRVLDSHNVTRRLYRFDPSSQIMTENDPAQPGKVLRRFVFDQYGMLEETFSFHHPPRTFRYEAGGERIVMREGGDYGAVSKSFSFEKDGISETSSGRDGGIERVYIFTPGTITIRAGGWYGKVERTLACERVDITVFQKPEAFLQFLMFTEKSARETEAEVEEQVAGIRTGKGTAPPVRRFAYSGRRPASGPVAGTRGDIDAGSPMRSTGRREDRAGQSPAQGGERPASRLPDTGIEFIPDADASPSRAAARPIIPRERSGQVPVEKRFRMSREADRTLSPGWSAEIPIDERFRSVREQDRTLPPGRSVEIPLDERFQGSREKKELSRGRSAEIPLDERFGDRNRNRTLSLERGTEVPPDERLGDRDHTFSQRNHQEFSCDERKTGRRLRNRDEL